MHHLSLIAFVAVLFGIAIIRLYTLFRKINGPEKVPGPTLIPYLGRIHDLPINFMWLKFYEWAKKYSGLNGFYLTEILGTSILVVTDEAVAEELMVKRAKYNSDRPAIPSIFDSKSTDGSMEYLPLMGKNQYWARQRRLTHAYLTEASYSSYSGLMYHEAKRWLVRLIESPDDFQFSLEDMASKVMCQLTWDDPDLSEDCVAHEMEADDVFRGYYLTKGTRILPLDWAFLRNPTKYPDPDNFRPERWLEPGWPTYQEPLTQFPTIKGMTSFGWGQRTCLGQTLTQDELIVACGALSWCFNLKPKKDLATGLDLPVPLDRSNSLLIIKPDPFQMMFEPRSEGRKQQALRLWAESEARDQNERFEFAKQATLAFEKLRTET
ncbi:hypothetical protein NUW58_g5044 [Xylaria curta]|uniref:Uncharacterized protein n=1 Tax=Xylaria curta TaxID=42375 RepID=A0ACC1P542_9PEZI|nr:hypothetical protein NUW58_g5044 [Xylaria curta]